MNLSPQRQYIQTVLAQAKSPSLLNVFPRLSAQHFQDCAVLNAESAGEFSESRFSWNIQPANFPYVIFGQFCARVVNSVTLFSYKGATEFFTASLSVFSHTVGAICRVISQEKMSRITAWRVIACVAYSFASRRFREAQFVDQSACSKVFLGGRNPKDTIARRLGTSFPFPAIIGMSDINKRPQSFDFFYCQIGQSKITLRHDLKVPFRLCLAGRI
jgi:hypothetical protein